MSRYIQCAIMWSLPLNIPNMYRLTENQMLVEAKNFVSRSKTNNQSPYIVDFEFEDGTIENYSVGYVKVPTEDRKSEDEYIIGRWLGGGTLYGEDGFFYGQEGVDYTIFSMGGGKRVTEDVFKHLRKPVDNVEKEDQEEDVQKGSSAKMHAEEEEEEMEPEDRGD